MHECNLLTIDFECKPPMNRTQVEMTSKVASTSTKYEYQNKIGNKHTTVFSNSYNNMNMDGEEPATEPGSPHQKKVNIHQASAVSAVSRGDSSIDRIDYVSGAGDNNFGSEEGVSPRTSNVTGFAQYVDKHVNNDNGNSDEVAIDLSSSENRSHHTDSDELFINNDNDDEETDNGTVTGGDTSGTDGNFKRNKTRKGNVENGREVNDTNANNDDDQDVDVEDLYAVVNQTENKMIKQVSTQW